jgi:hypothetical protein
MRLSFQLIQPTLNSLHVHLLLLALITRPNAAVTANCGYREGFGSLTVRLTSAGKPIYIDL